jgi:hypothetical protein
MNLILKSAVYVAKTSEVRPEQKKDRATSNKTDVAMAPRLEPRRKEANNGNV